MLHIEHSWFEQTQETKVTKTVEHVRPGNARTTFLLFLGFIVGTFIFISNYYVSPTQAAGPKTLPTAIEDFQTNLGHLTK